MALLSLVIHSSIHSSSSQKTSGKGFLAFK